MMKKNNLPVLYDQIAALLKPYQAFLVGGAVRDLFLEKPVHDLDFALPADTIPAAKFVADQLGGAFFVLDQKRETARVILKDNNGQRIMVDFTRFQGKSIEDDLLARDFTITSMARKVSGDEKIIDPFNGAQDLKDKLLRSTTEGALGDDPLRCLRAVRLAAQFGLRILPDTKDQIRQHNRKLKEISPERIRDELFRILDGPKQTAALKSLDILGLSPYVFFGEITDEQIKGSRFLEDLWFLFRKEHDQDSSANWFLALLVHRLGRYRADLQTYLNRRPVPDRTIYQLSFIAALLNHLKGENGIGDLRKNLPLSNQEWEILVQSTQAADTVFQISQAGEKPQPVDIYRYYRQHGSAGILGVFLALSSSSANYKNTANQENWITILEISRLFLEAWWEKKDQWVQPPIVLSGDDIQSEFALMPGPRIGALLESLREAQVERGISSREGAIQYLNELLDQENEMPA